METAAQHHEPQGTGAVKLPRAFPTGPNSKGVETLQRFYDPEDLGHRLIRKTIELEQKPSPRREADILRITIFSLGEAAGEALIDFDESKHARASYVLRDWGQSGGTGVKLFNIEVDRLMECFIRGGLRAAMKRTVGNFEYVQISPAQRSEFEQGYPRWRRQRLGAGLPSGDQLDVPPMVHMAQPVVAPQSPSPKEVSVRVHEAGNCYSQSRGDIISERIREQRILPGGAVVTWMKDKDLHTFVISNSGAPIADSRVWNLRAHWSSRKLIEKEMAGIFQKITGSSESQQEALKKLEQFDSWTPPIRRELLTALTLGFYPCRCPAVETFWRQGSIYHGFWKLLSDIAEQSSLKVAPRGKLSAYDLLHGYQGIHMSAPDREPYEFSKLSFFLDQAGNGKAVLENQMNGSAELIFPLTSSQMREGELSEIVREFAMSGAAFPGLFTDERLISRIGLPEGNPQSAGASWRAYKNLSDFYTIFAGIQNISVSSLSIGGPFEPCDHPDVHKGVVGFNPGLWVEMGEDGFHTIAIERAMSRGCAAFFIPEDKRGQIRAETICKLFLGSKDSELQENSVFQYLSQYCQPESI